MKARVNDYFDFSLEDKDFNWDCVEIKNGQFHVLFKGRSLVADVIEVDPSEKVFVIRINNNSYHVELKDRYDELLQSLGMDTFSSKKETEIKAPMPGRVLDVMVHEGDRISKGDNVVVLEAMKMENVIKSPTGGVVKNVCVVKEEAVEKNQVLITFK